MYGAAACQSMAVTTVPGPSIMCKSGLASLFPGRPAQNTLFWPRGRKPIGAKPNAGVGYGGHCNPTGLTVISACTLSSPAYGIPEVRPGRRR